MFKRFVLLSCGLLLATSCAPQNLPTTTNSPTASGATLKTPTKVSFGPMELLIKDPSVCWFSREFDGSFMANKLVGNGDKPCDKELDMSSTFDQWSLDTETGKLEKTDTVIGAMGYLIKGTDRSKQSPDGRYSIREVTGIEEKAPKDLGKIFLQDAQTGRESVLLEGTFKTGADNKYIENTYRFVGWSPDSRWVVIGNNSNSTTDTTGHLAVYKIEYGLVDVQSPDRTYKPLGLSVLTETDRLPAEAHWSPDSTRVALDDGQPIFDITTMKQIYTPELEVLNNNVVWSPKSSYAAFTLFKDQKFDLFLLDRDGKKLRTLAQARPPESFPAFVWISDTEFVYMDEKGVLHQENVDGSLKATVPVDKSVTVSRIFVTKDGRWLIIADAKGALYHMKIQ